MSDTDLSRAYALDGRGGGEEGRYGELELAGRAAWLRFDFQYPDLERILEEQLGLDDAACASLLAEDTRPRSQKIGDAALVILRGVNLNPDAEPEDMISIRIWVDAEKLVSVQLRRLHAARSVADDLAAGRGPATPGDLLVDLAEALTERMQPTVDAMDERLDALERGAATTDVDRCREEAADLRRDSVALRRFIGPQRDALGSLVAQRYTWQTEEQDRLLQDVVDRVSRIVEDLDEIQTRAAIFQDALAVAVAERMNRAMFVLSIVTGVFLPISFITGLLGVNVGGMPGADDPFAFWIVVAILAALAASSLWLFKRFRIF